MDSRMHAPWAGKDAPKNDDAPGNHARGTEEQQQLDFGCDSLPQQPASASLGRFYGTSNPRHLRVLEALTAGPVMREQLDRIAGASNGPELVSELRRLGLEVPCRRISRRDRDGRACRPGRYSLSATDRQKLHRWRIERTQGRRP